MMKSVKRSMFNLHFWSVSLDVGITVLTKPFVLFPAMAGVPLGMLTSFGVPTGLQIYIIVTLFCIVCAAIVSIFENRYYLTFGRNSIWRKFRVSFTIFNYILAFFIFLPAYLNSPDQSIGLQIVYEALPELPDSIKQMSLFVIATDFSVVIVPVVFMGGFIWVQAMLFVVTMYLGTQKAIKLMTISIHTLYMHKRFLRALYIQICMILLNIGVPLIYLAFAVPLHYYNQAANNICFIIYSLHGSISTIVMVWLHKPYRMVIENLFCREKSRRASTDGARRKSVLDGHPKPAYHISNCNVRLNVNIVLTTS